MGEVHIRETTQKWLQRGTQEQRRSGAKETRLKWMENEIIR